MSEKILNRERKRKEIFSQVETKGNTNAESFAIGSAGVVERVNWGGWNVPILFYFI